MKLLTLFLTTLLLLPPKTAYSDNIKISALPLGTAAASGLNDSFPYVAASTNITKRVKLWDLINLPPMVTTYAPLASPTFTGTVTAPTFVGALTGTASNATNVTATVASTNVSFFPLFVGSSTTGSQASRMGTGLSFNPSTNALSTTTFIGALTGNASTATAATSATSATNATNVGVTDDTTTNATMYPAWFTTTTGNLPAKVSSSKFTFNPSTGSVTATTFVGALTGNASTATSATSATSATTATNATNTAITDDTTTNATMYPTWVTAASSNNPQKVSSTKLTFNPSTGLLSTTALTTTGAVTISEISTPSSPSASTDKVYFKSDNNLYQLNSSGTETKITSTNLTIQNKSTTYLALTTDDAINADATSAAFTITMFAATAGSKPIIIKKTDSTLNAVTIARAGSDTFTDVSSSLTSLTLNTQGESVTIVPNGTATFYVFNRRIPSQEVSYTPTGAWSTNTTYSGYYKREGSGLFFHVRAALTGAPNAADLTFTYFPSGASFATGSIPSTTGLPDLNGSCDIQASGNHYHGWPVYSSSTVMKVLSIPGVNTATHNGSFVSNTVPSTYASGDYVDCTFRAPVTGWSQ